MKEILRKLLGIRNYEEDFDAGVKYVQDELRKYGKHNMMENNRMWAECDSSGIDPAGFDAGMRQALKTFEIPHPFDEVMYGTTRATTNVKCGCGRGIQTART
jgi:hypothetical protein